MPVLTIGYDSNQCYKVFVDGGGGITQIQEQGGYIWFDVPEVVTPAGKQVTVTAFDKSGYKFDYWIRSDHNPEYANEQILSNPHNFGMPDYNLTMQAFFKEESVPTQRSYAQTMAARVPTMGNSKFIQFYMRRIRDKIFSKKMHERLHPLI